MPGRKWFQFSLRSFLAVVTVFAIWLGWNVDRAAKQHAAIKAVGKLGGGTSYVWQTRPEDGYPGNWVRPVPEWLCALLGEDLFSDVGLVWFGPETVDTDLRWLNYFDAASIRFLSLNGPELTDTALDAVPYMPNLKTLKLCGAGITDDGLENLSKCPDITDLHLQFAPKVTDAGTRTLTRLTKLRRLCIEHTQMTPRGVESLRRSLPQCEVLF